MYVSTEYRRMWSGFRRRVRPRRQHEGRGHPPGTHGNDRVREHILPGEQVIDFLRKLRHRRSHHDLLRGEEQENQRSFRQDQQVD